MADLYKNTLASGASTTLQSLTEHGRVKIAHEGQLKVEHEIDDNDWQVLYEGPGPLAVIDYTGTKLKLTNTSAAAFKVRAGQEP